MAAGQRDDLRRAKIRMLCKIVIGLYMLTYIAALAF